MARFAIVQKSLCLIALCNVLVSVGGHSSPAAAFMQNGALTQTAATGQGQVHMSVSEALERADLAVDAWSTSNRALGHMGLTLRTTGLHQSVCFALVVVLFFSMCCLGEAEDRVLRSASLLVPLLVLLYVCIGTDILQALWRGEQVGIWCAILCVWSFVQLLCCVPAVFCFGAALVVHEVAELESKQQAPPFKIRADSSAPPVFTYTPRGTATPVLPITQAAAPTAPTSAAYTVAPTSTYHTTAPTAFTHTAPPTATYTVAASPPSTFAPADSARVPVTSTNVAPTSSPLAPANSPLTSAPLAAPAADGRAPETRIWADDRSELLRLEPAPVAEGHAPSSEIWPDMNPSQLLTPEQAQQVANVMQQTGASQQEAVRALEDCNWHGGLAARALKNQEPA